MGKETFQTGGKRRWKGNNILFDPKFTDFKIHQPKAIDVNKKKAVFAQ